MSPSKGIYAVVWDDSLRTENLDKMLNWVKANNFTDLYVECGVSAYYVEPMSKQLAALRYCAFNKGDLKIHAYLRGLKLWSLSKPLDDYTREGLFTDGSLIYFDPTTEFTKNYFLTYVQHWASVDDVEGVLIDNLWYPNPHCGRGTPEERKQALTDLMISARSVTDKPLGVICQSTVDTTKSLQDHLNWGKRGLIDYLAPMIRSWNVRNMPVFATNPVPKKWSYFAETINDMPEENSIRFRYVNNH